MDHDRLFKQLLMTFFFEFVVLFLPEVDKYLSHERVEFLDKEIFSVPSGNHIFRLIFSSGMIPPSQEHRLTRGF